MTTAEVAHATRKPTGGRSVAGNGAGSNWSDQAVLSGAGLVTESIERTRTNATALLDVADEVVNGTFELIDEWNSQVARIVPVMTSKPSELARRAYTTMSTAVRQAITEA